MARAPGERTSSMKQTPVKRRFRVDHSGEVGATRNDNLFLETDTDLGTVAFWGKRNIDQVQVAKPPIFIVGTDARLPCVCAVVWLSVLSDVLWPAA